MSDQIMLTGMKFFGHHGCTPEERAVGQIIAVDVELNLDLSNAGSSDDPLTTSLSSMRQK